MDPQAQLTGVLVVLIQTRKCHMIISIGVHIHPKVRSILQLMVIILNIWPQEVTTVLAGSKDLLMCRALTHTPAAMITIVKEVMYLIIQFLAQCLPFLGLLLVIPLPLLWVDLHPR